MTKLLYNRDIWGDYISFLGIRNKSLAKRKRHASGKRINISAATISSHLSTINSSLLNFDRWRYYFRGKSILEMFASIAITLDSLL